MAAAALAAATQFHPPGEKWIMYNEHALENIIDGSRWQFADNKGKNLIASYDAATKKFINVENLSGPTTVPPPLILTTNPPFGIITYFRPYVEIGGIGGSRRRRKRTKTIKKRKGRKGRKGRKSRKY